MPLSLGIGSAGVNGAWAQMNVYQRVNSSIHPMTSPAVPKMTPSAMRDISFRVLSNPSPIVQITVSNGHIRSASMARHGIGTMCHVLYRFL